MLLLYLLLLSKWGCVDIHLRWPIICERALYGVQILFGTLFSPSFVFLPSYESVKDISNRKEGNFLKLCWYSLYRTLIIFLFDPAFLIQYTRLAASLLNAFLGSPICKSRQSKFPNTSNSSFPMPRICLQKDHYAGHDTVERRYTQLQ